MKQVFNPYLPLNEYIPDGEPHVFGDRLYIYGSHDEAGVNEYCVGDYVVWSAPIEDLSNWRCDGVSYQRIQDPTNHSNTHKLWAPDVARGLDGRYYLYYCLSYVPEIGVAVSEKPHGPFEFYGHVKYDLNIYNGAVLHEHLPFDPAIFMDEDGKIYLYYGFSPIKPYPTKEELMERGISEEAAEIEAEQLKRMGRSSGCMVVELKPDMLTMVGEPKMIVPGGLIEAGTGFEGHGFFEASSMRKIRGRYYLVFSSRLSHELCYAVSDFPHHDFSYGGTIISNGDVGLNGNEKPKNMTGNNHGGIVEVNGQYYIFYHRQTHGIESSRQGCAEKITILEDGSIPQVEMTSCGLNGGPLTKMEKYEAVIVCNIISPCNQKKINYGENLCEDQPYIFEEAEETGEKVHYIANIYNGVTVGYKYFDCKGIHKVEVCIRGNANGTIQILLESEEGFIAGKIPLKMTGQQWKTLSAEVQISDGVHGIFFRYEGDGKIEFRNFNFIVY